LSPLPTTVPGIELPVFFVLSHNPADVNDRIWNSWRTSLVCLTLGLTTLALFAPVLGHDFLSYDDQVYVTENAHVRAGLTWDGLLWAFQGSHASNWHPLTWLSHMLDCQLYGLNPLGHHLTNVLLHAANSMLLFLVLYRMTGAVWRSASVAALFAWHPLHVESVAWVAERKDVLSAFFWLLTMLAYARYAQESKVQSPKSKVFYGLALLCFALGLMAKPMVVTLPFVLLLLDFWPLRRVSDFKGLSRLLLEKVPLFILAAITCALTIWAQGQANAIVPTAGLPISRRIPHAIVSYLHYIVATLWPRHLAVFYPYEGAAPPTQLIFTAVLLLLITVLVLRFARWQFFLATGWFWFLGTLVPVIGLVQVGDQAWADRYMYLPSIGLFVLIVWSAVDFVGNRKVIGVLAGAVALALAWATALQLGHWKNTRTLFEHTAQVTRNNYMAITMLGSLFAKDNQFDRAIQCFDTALRYKPGYPEAHFFRGNVLDQQGKLDEAIGEYRQAVWFKPVQEQARILLGVALGKQQKYAEAMTEYQAALALNPDSAVAHNNLARLLHTQGRLDEAIQHYSAALKLDPDLAQAHNNLGILLLQKGRLAESTAQLREALRLSPGNLETQLNLAQALNQQGEGKEAAELLAVVVRAAPNDAQVHYQLGLALEQMQKTREAMGRYAQALLLQPDFAEVLNHLAWILATDPRPEFRNGVEAVRMAGRSCELTEQKQALPLLTLAAAYAEAGRFPEAVATAQQARTLAAGAQQKELTAKCEDVLKTLQSNAPYRLTLAGTGIDARQGRVSR